MDTAKWPQGVGVVQLPNMEVNNSEAAVVDHQRSNNNNNNNIHSKPIAAPRPQKPQAINCPRCNSTHTKFCYYNNYSLSQPRYFCKTCRRYWTEGGSLRNVPVGGGLRKNKRSSSSSTSALASKKLPESINITPHQNPNNISIFHHEGQDLNLAYPPIRNPSSTYGIPDQFVDFPNSNSSTQNNFSQLLKSAGISGGSRSGLSSFMSMIPISDPNGTGLLYSSSTSGSGFPYQDYSKTSGLNFSLNHHDQGGFDDSAGNHTGGYESSLQGVHRENMSSANNHPKLFNFPFEDLKQPADHHGVATTRTSGHELMDQNEETRRQGDDHLQSSGLIWSNGGLGGGASW